MCTSQLRSRNFVPKCHFSGRHHCCHHRFLQNIKFFSVALHTPVIMSEAGDCGTTMTRVQSGEMAGIHETRQLNSYAPIWVMDIVCQVNKHTCTYIYVNMQYMVMYQVKKASTISILVTIAAVLYTLLLYHYVMYVMLLYYIEKTSRFCQAQLLSLWRQVRYKKVQLHAYSVVLYYTH